MATVGLPLTGTGDSTASVATDLIGGAHYQRVKLFDGVEGSTLPIGAKATTPDAADGGMIVRPIGSTAFNQAVVGAVGITSGSSAVGITSGSSAVELTSAGSTRLAGRFTMDNPTTAVNVANPTTSVTVTNPTTSVSLSSQHTVTADLSSAGSTKVVGIVNATGTTKVDVSSGVILAAGSSGNVIGAVAVNNPTTAVTVSSGVVLGAGSSANILGQVAQGPGSSASPWFHQSIAFTSANVARSSVATSVDAAVVAANANRKALIVAAGSTTQTVAIGLTTGVMTTALANLSMYLAPAGQLTFGLSGGMPLYTGPVRGINVTSTAVGGGVVVTEFT